VVLKAFAGRAQDWVDIEYLLVRQRGKLDWGQIEGELRPLIELSDAPEKLDTLAKLKAGIEKGG
jgi:hypothetical protein